MIDNTGSEKHLRLFMSKVGESGSKPDWVGSIPTGGAGVVDAEIGVSALNEALVPGGGLD